MAATGTRGGLRRGGVADPRVGVDLELGREAGASGLPHHAAADGDVELLDVPQLGRQVADDLVVIGLRDQDQHGQRRRTGHRHPPVNSMTWSGSGRSGAAGSSSGEAQARSTPADSATAAPARVNSLTRYSLTTTVMRFSDSAVTLRRRVPLSAPQRGVHVGVRRLHAVVERRAAGAGTAPAGPSGQAAR